jgi:hypothetical protein
VALFICVLSISSWMDLIFSGIPISELWNK